MESSDLAHKLSFSKALSVYQILEMPEDLLQALLRIDKKAFRKYAREIHPDKNGHP
jgi:DnaJ-class molecular chaperone